jgi:uncharacterized membrane protein
MTANQTENQPPLAPDSRLSSNVNLPTFGMLISLASIIFLIYAFFSGLSYQFYASFLFLFYDVTNSMWVSVVLLGIFQTFLLIPFRMIRVIKASSIKDFQQEITQLKTPDQQEFVLKKKFRQGNVTFLFYAVDFIMQLVSYISMGRLFLTDFYTKNINPDLLYSWVPYPDYPITDTFFKIPYLSVTKTTDFGWQVLLIVWLALIVIQALVFIARRAIRSQQGSKTEQKLFAGRWGRYTSGYLVAFLIIAWFAVRHFPTAWEFRIFSGDVSIPNRTFNTITAIATFSVLIYHGFPRIARKSQLAERMNLPSREIGQLQNQMFKDTVFNASAVGLGAFFITNQIPSAFELSIFTLEVISLAAPFTVDRLVLKNLGTPKSTGEMMTGLDESESEVNEE